MKLIELLQSKYRKPDRYALRKAYAEAFNISYPLAKGWVQKFGDMEITPEMLRKAKEGQSKHRKAAKEKRAAFGIKGSEHHAISDDFLQSFEWRKLRMQVLKKYGAKCMCCGAVPASGVVMNVDHIKPRRKHPHLALVFDNLQVLCNPCNHGKGNWDETDWRPVAGSER